MRLSKKTKIAAREALGRMADPEIQKRIEGELFALSELVVSTLIYRSLATNPVDENAAHLEANALIGEIQQEAILVAEWCVTGKRPKSMRARTRPKGE